MSGAASASSWQIARLGEIAEIIRGLAFPSTDKAFQGGEGLIACLRTTNVQREVEWSDLWFIPRKHVRNERQVIRTNDILISTANSYELVGKVAQVKNLPVEATLGAFISMIRANSELSPKYIHYQLSSSDVQQRIREMASTTTNISNVSTSKLAELDLNIAPRAEQDRIVAEIEKQFTRLDDAVAALKRVQANLKRYRASVLKAACEGRLVPTEAELAHKEGRTYESASELLERILAERRAKWQADQLQKMIDAGKPPKNNEWKKKYKEPQPPELPALSDLPAGWTWATLEQVTDRITDGTHLPPPFVQDGIPFIFVQHIVDGKIAFKNTKFISKEVYESLNARCPVELGDVLYTAVGSYGVAVEIKTDAPFSFQRHIAHLRRPRVMASYLSKCLNSPIVLAQAHRAARGVAQKTVTLGDLTKFVIPIPPLDEQNRIVTVVEKSEGMVEHLIQQVDQENTRSLHLRKSTLSSAFHSKLVLQDPNDEPASVLLERIRAERAALATNNGNQMATPEAAAANGQRRRRVARLAHR